MKIQRTPPYYNLKYINETTNWTNSGFSYFWHKEPVSICEKNNSTVKSFVNEDIGVKVEVKEEYFDGINVIKQENTVLKTDETKCVLNSISSAFFGGIPFEELDDIIVHYTDFAWQTEGQWKKETLSECGIHPGGNHGVFCAKKIFGIGTFSTEKHYPLVILENIKTKKSYFFELEASTNWYIEIGIKGKCVYIEGSCAFENNDGWFLDMKKGDTYTATAAVIGMIDGGFNEAVNELLKYKRTVSMRNFDEKIPVVFNTYMNSLWCNLTKDKLIPLIDAAKNAGADIFCMDAGWYDFLGDWNIKEESFGDMKLQGIVDYINKKGMKAGIWLESEGCDNTAQAYTKYSAAICKRHGITVGGSRVNMDFRCKEFKSFMVTVVGKLYDMGIRYIKNDYNFTTGFGIDGEKCPSYELRETSNAFCEFIEEINHKYSDLIIENCGSGGMRCDGNMLKHFFIQSTSDLEQYHYYPSVMIGMNACIPPEKAGIWSYPYPLFFSQQNKSEDEVFDNLYISERKNGEETVFNMVTSMFGCMYLSGRPDKCDEYNFSLIKEGVSAYKSFCDKIKNSYPIFTVYPPNTTNSYNTSFGLFNKEEKTIILGVWNYKAKRDYSVDLSKHIDGNAKIRLLYPSDSKTQYELKNQKLNLIFDKDIDAAVFEIKL